jgi:hypothetical protein
MEQQGQQQAAAAGSSSSSSSGGGGLEPTLVEELVGHVAEQRMAAVLAPEQEAAVAQRLQPPEQRAEQALWRLRLRLRLARARAGRHVHRAGDHGRQLAGVARCHQQPAPGPQQRDEADGLGHLRALVQDDHRELAPLQHRVHGGEAGDAHHLRHLAGQKGGRQGGSQQEQAAA